MRVHIQSLLQQALNAIEEAEAPSFGEDDYGITRVWSDLHNDVMNALEDTKCRSGLAAFQGLTVEVKED